MYVGGNAAGPVAAPVPAPAPLVALGPLGPSAVVAAQNSSFGETQLTGVGPIYKKQDSLEPVSMFAPVSNMPASDMRLKSSSTWVQNTSCAFC